MKQLLLLLIVTVLFLTVGCGEEKKDAKISEPTGNAMIIAEGPLTLYLTFLYQMEVHQDRFQISLDLLSGNRVVLFSQQP